MAIFSAGDRARFERDGDMRELRIHSMFGAVEPSQQYD
jgi:hypothetical protein